jgi:Lauroyl/myristoyl acyltransferase
MAKKRRKRKTYKGPGKWLGYVFARGIVTGLQNLPMGLSYRLGRGLGWLGWKLMAKRRATVLKNLKIVNEHLSKVAPEKAPKDDLDVQVREVFMRSAANLLCGFGFVRLSRAQMDSHLEIKGIEHLKTALDQGKGAVVVMSHMGPWEALPHLNKYSEELGIDAQFGAIYRKFNNDYLDAWFIRQREALGARLFESRKNFYGPAEFLRGGGMLGILSDQRASGGEEIVFFGRNVRGTPLPGLLHLRTKAPMVAVAVYTIGHCRWRIEFFPMESAVEDDVRDRKSLAKICALAVEKCLSESVYDGFWFHNRFR